MIVSDAGPIIIFARIGRLSLLRDVAGFLLIPDAVYDEIVFKKGGMPGADQVAQSPMDPESACHRPFNHWRLAGRSA
jgi:predicted nucleic acid-binding protein